MTYPILYSPEHTDFNNLGLGVMVDTISATVSEELNGKFELELVYQATGSLFKYIVKNGVIKVNTGDQENQLFVIKKVTKPLKGKIGIHAEHVSYITNDLPIKPSTKVVESVAQVALNKMLSAIADKHPLTAYSDITTISSAEWKVPDFKNPRNILGGVEGSILDQWGGEYQFDNYQIRLTSQRGRYSNTIIAYGRNLTDFEQEESILETYTSIYPYANETSNDSTVLRTLPEFFVDSEYVDKYPNRRVAMVDFSDKFNDKNPYSEDKLRKFAQSYVKANKVGVPKITMKVSTVDLSGSLDENYNVEEVESLHLADTVKVFFEPLGVTAEAKVVGSVWNVLLEQYDSYTLGAKKASFDQWVNNNVNEIKNAADSAKQTAINAAISANGKNTNYYGNSGDGFPANPKVGDLYFQRDGDKTTVYQWDGTSWVKIIDGNWQVDFEQEMQDKLDAAQKELDDAMAANNEALADLDGRLTENTEALGKNEIALTDLGNQLSDAQTAIDSVEVSNTAISQAVDQAQKDASSALAKADDAAISALNAQQLANTAITNLNDYGTKTDASIAQLNNKLSLTVSNAEYQADKSKVDIRLSNIELTQDGITSTVTAAKNLTNNMNLLFNSTWNDGFKGWAYYEGQGKIKNPESDKPTSNILQFPADTLHYTTSQNKVQASAGQKFTISFDVRVSRTDDSSKNLMILRAYNSDESSFWTYSMNMAAGVNNGLTAKKWTRLSFIATIPKGADHFRIVTGHGGGATGTAMDFREVMVTQYLEGEIPNWSPSMYDLDTTNISQITQLSDNINLAVMKDDVITQINISQEGILISGKVVHITGQTTIDSAVISTTMIQDAAINDAKISNLSGDKIFANSITSLQLAAASVTTEALAANSVTATQIAAGSITSDKILAGSVTTKHLATDSVTANQLAVGAVVMGSATVTGTIDASKMQVLNIDAGNIKVGTLNAATVRIINLDAGAITTGSLNVAVQINANSIVTGRLNAKFLVGDTAHLNSVDTGVIQNTVDEQLQLNANGMYNASENIGQINLTSKNSTRVDFPGGITFYRNPYDNKGERWGIRIYGNQIMSLNKSQNANLELMPYGGASVRVRNRSGNAYCAIMASAFNVASDRRFKSDIKDYKEDALEIINSLRIRTYKKSGKREIGVIADETPQSLLIKNKDGDMLSLYDYSSVAVKAIQELTDEVHSLKSQIKEMEKKIA